MGNQGNINPQQTQIQPPAQDNQQFISTGSPEVPGAVDRGEVAKPAEYGHEVIKRIEATPEGAQERAERKDKKYKDQQRRQPKDDPKQQKLKKKTSDYPSPKYFGYNIPPQISNNYKLIKKNTGKGDPSSSATWIWVLLDRLLKVRTVNP